MGKHSEFHKQMFKQQTQAMRTFEAKAKCPKCKEFHTVKVGSPAVRLLHEYCPTCKKNIEGEDVYGYNQGYY